jgi:hypothetical protein
VRHTFTSSIAINDWRNITVGADTTCAQPVFRRELTSTIGSAVVTVPRTRPQWECRARRSGSRQTQLLREIIVEAMTRRSTTAMLGSADCSRVLFNYGGPIAASGHSLVDRGARHRRTFGGREQRVETVMSQRSAAWNLAFQVIPAIGLVFVFLGPMARFAPARFFLVSTALSTVGLCLFIAAKASLFVHGRFVSWGSKEMSPWNRRAYRAGYLLMVCGIVASVVFAVVWRSR